MKLFKDLENVIWAFEIDGSQDHLIKSDMIPVSDEEANSINQAKEENFFNNLPYTMKRAMKYPPITDYLDGVVKGDQAQIDKYIADCQAVKDMYPKV